MRWRLVYSLATLVGLLFLLPSSFAAEDSAKDFESLFGKEAKQAAVSSNPKDSADFAARVLSVADTLKDNAGLKAFLYAKAYEFGIRSPLGYVTAIDAVKRLAETAPERDAECQEKLLDVYQLAYKASKTAKDKAATAEVLAEQLVEVADAQVENGSADKMGEYCRQAQSLLPMLKPERKEDLQARLKQVTARLAMAQQVESLKARLQKDPKDKAAAEKLLQLYLVDRDNPTEAAKYADLGADETTQKYLLVAGMKLENLPENACLALAGWYHELAAPAAASNKPALLRRVEAYSERFLELHAAEDASRAKAAILLEGARKELGGLGRRVSKGAILILTFDKETIVEKEGHTYVKDLSSNGNAAEVFGATFEKGRTGQAVAFDGAKAYLRLIRSDLVELAGKSWTISFYMFPQAGVDHAIIDKDNEEAGFGVWLHARRVRYWYEANEDKDSEATLALNKWHHVVLAYDAAQKILSFHIDGKPDKTYAVPGPRPSRGLPLDFGRRRGGDAYYKGLLDDVCIFGRVLSAEEIKQLE